MKRKSKKWTAMFLAGALCLGVCTATAVGGGERKSIDVLVGGISIYVDGVLQETKNVKGDPVQPIIWEGTTYLPVRAVTGMLTDKEVNWDQATMSVYIGKQPAAPSVRLDKLKMYKENSEYAFMVTDSQAAFRKADKTVEAYNRLGMNYYNDHYSEDYYTGYATYILDSQYSKLTGKLDVEYTEIGAKKGIGLAFYSVDSYGEENLIQKYFVKAGDPPVNVEVPLAGVATLKIKRIGAWDEEWPYDRSEIRCDIRPALYNVVLETA